MATIREANKIDLYKDVDATAVAPMTRNDVAQLALNTLKAYQVEADNDTINVEGNGVSVSGGSVKYYQLVSNDKMYKAIDDRTGLSMSNVSGYTKELGEDLYDGDLECKDETRRFRPPRHHLELQELYHRHLLRLCRPDLDWQGQREGPVHCRWFRRL